MLGAVHDPRRCFVPTVSTLEPTLDLRTVSRFTTDDYVAVQTLRTIHLGSRVVAENVPERFLYVGVLCAGLDSATPIATARLNPAVRSLNPPSGTDKLDEHVDHHDPDRMDLCQRSIPLHLRY